MAEVYQEDAPSLLWHLGHYYDLNVLFRLTHGMPVTRVSVLLLDMPNTREWTDEDWTRVQAADVTVPILVLKSDTVPYVILDGVHRAAKARQMRLTALPAILVAPETLSRARI